MEERAIGKCGDAIQLFLQNHAIEIGLGASIYDEFDQRASLGDSLLGIVKLAYVKAHHLAGHIPHVTARIGVVAHVSHAILRQVLLANCQQLIAHLLRNPGIDSMGDDEIESAQTLTDVHDVELPKLQILKTKLPRALLPLEDSCGSEIYPDTFCFGQVQRYRSQIESVTAAELEHASASNIRRFHSEERRDRRQPVRMGLRQRMP